MRRMGLVVATAATTLLAVFPVSSVKATTRESEECPAASGDLTVREVPEGTNVVECGFAGEDITDGDLSLQIPQPGESLTMEMVYVDGAETLSVAVDDEGEVSYPEPTASGGGSSTTAPSACNDGAYTDKDEEQAGRWNWYLGDGVRPGGLSTAQTVDAMKLALDGLSTGYTDCSNVAVQWSQFDLSALYNGGSDLESDFRIENGESKCGDGSSNGRDGKSVVDFGNLDGGGKPAIASECTWDYDQPFNNDNIVESDVRFNTTNFDFYVYNKPSPCVAGEDFDLRSIAVHEFGHTFGMGHVDEETHGNLTMSTVSPPCSSSPQTLGKGDILSLNNTYAN